MLILTFCKAFTRYSSSTTDLYKTSRNRDNTEFRTIYSIYSFPVEFNSEHTLSFTKKLDFNIRIENIEIKSRIISKQ